MTITLDKLFTTFFCIHDREDDLLSAEDFYESDAENLAELYFQNADEDYSEEAHERIRELSDDFHDLVHSLFRFRLFVDEETGVTFVRAY